MNDIQNYEIFQEDVGQRLDIFLNENCELSRSYIKTLIESDKILVNGKSTKAGYFLRINDKIYMELPPPKIMDLTPCDIPLDIVYEDEYFAVINKKQGMVVHPASGCYENTLVNALLFHFKNLSAINGVYRPGIVHRIDKNTSGLLVVAKTDKAHIDLQEQISTKSAQRFYIALVDGVIKADNGIINNYIDRSQKDRKLFCVSRDNVGRNAITNYKVIMRYKNYSLVEFQLQTGRTHQIRVHSKHIGHPIVGDKEYGGSNKFDLQGQLLHAFKLELSHPITRERMLFTAEIPDYFQEVLSKLIPLVD